MYQRGSVRSVMGRARNQRATGPDGFLYEDGGIVSPAPGVLQVNPMPLQLVQNTKRKRLPFEEGGQVTTPPIEDLQQPEVKKAKEEPNTEPVSVSKDTPNTQSTTKTDDLQDDKITGLASVDQRNYNSIKNILIKGIVIVRAPVKKGAVTALNALSLGTLKSIQRKLGYDTLFHIGIKLELANGQSWRLEKTQNISLKRYEPHPDTQTVVIPVNKSITLKDLMNKLYKKQGDDMYEYDAFTNNCQMFIRDLLSTSGMFPASAASFVSQNTEAIHQSLPGYVPIITKGFTKIGSAADRLIQKFFGKKLFRTGGQITI